jgi:hypothetical protein
MILVQKSPIFYGQKFVTFGYQLMLTLFVQLMGMGVAGFLRHFSVYPVKGINTSHGSRFSNRVQLCGLLCYLRSR